MVRGRPPERTSSATNTYPLQPCYGYGAKERLYDEAERMLRKIEDSDIIAHAWRQTRRPMTGSLFHPTISIIINKNINAYMPRLK